MSSQFVTTINCMDGRTQLPVIEWMKQQYDQPYVDSITEPGPIKILAEQKNQSVLDSIKHRLDISINNHGSSIITIVAHYDCAGNPVEKETQLTQLKASIELLNKWYPTVTIQALWVDEKWTVHPVDF